MITEFQGEYRFLSNFWPSLVRHDGLQYPTVEHAFQAAKTLDFAKRWEISQIPENAPGEAKRAGRGLVLRPDWELVKRFVMQELLIQKFFLHTGLRRQLLATGNVKLIEGNRWHDQYWGNCECDAHARIPGENHLGQQLAAVRMYFQR